MLLDPYLWPRTVDGQRLIGIATSKLYPIDTDIDHLNSNLPIVYEGSLRLVKQNKIIESTQIEQPFIVDANLKYSNNLFDYSETLDIQAATAAQGSLFVASKRVSPDTERINSIQSIVTDGDFRFARIYFEFLDNLQPLHPSISKTRYKQNHFANDKTYLDIDQIQAVQSIFKLGIHSLSLNENLDVNLPSVVSGNLGVKLKTAIANQDHFDIAAAEINNGLLRQILFKVDAEPLYFDIDQVNSVSGIFKRNVKDYFIQYATDTIHPFISNGDLIYRIKYLQTQHFVDLNSPIVVSGIFDPSQSNVTISLQFSNTGNVINLIEDM